MSRALKLLLGATLCLQAGVARSQAPATAPPAPAVNPPANTGVAAPSAAPPGGPVAPDVNVPVRQRPSLSPAEMMTQARDYRTRMEQIVRQMDTLIEQARRQKDVIRLNCLYDRIGQLKANVTIADGALQSLAEANARHDEGAAAHEYTRITIVHQKAQVLSGEGQACVGEDLAYVGATRVDVEVEGVPDVPTEPAVTATPPDRPPTASPSE
jgi:hypothetical protein